MLRHFTQLFIGVVIVGHSAKRHFDEVIRTLFSSGFLLSSVSSVFRLYVSLISQVKKGPQIPIALQHNVTSTATVAAIGPSFWDEFFSP